MNFLACPPVWVLAVVDGARRAKVVVDQSQYMNEVELVKKKTRREERRG
jgi:hypothetical protein